MSSDEDPTNFILLLTLLCSVIALGQATEAAAHVPASSPERQAISMRFATVNKSIPGTLH
jgi:hypothetical protein